MARLKLCLSLLILFSVFIPKTFPQVEEYSKSDIDDNEFADFDFGEFDEDMEDPKTIVKTDEEEIYEQDDSDVDVQVSEPDEFENFADEEEFEVKPNKLSDDKSEEKFKPGSDNLSFIKAPMSKFYNYYVEIALITGLVCYALFYLFGKYRNSDIASAWLAANLSFLSDNFLLVGDENEGASAEENMQYFTEESCNLFVLWCSGRPCCEGMLVELKLIKRHELISWIISMITGDRDEINIKIPLSKEDSDNYVFCVANKLLAADLAKDLADINSFCPDRKSVDKYGIPSNFSVMSEIGEVATNFFDAKTVSMFERFSELINYAHISDRYSGPKQTEENSNPENPPEYKRMLIVSYSLASNSFISNPDAAAQHVQPILPLIFYWLDRIKKFHLSKEGKTKSDKNRSRIDQAFLKTANAARSEAAAQRKEEKRKQEKEQLLQDDDPDKQRRWEEREMKRQMKKKTPRMKQLKVKSI